MKKLLVLLFSLFFLSSPPVFADDISDFQIEGISIGDSLLDYMTEDEILEWFEITKDSYSYLKEPNKYAEVYLEKEFQSYKVLTFFVKNNSPNQYITDGDEKYTILSVRGMIKYNEDFDSCIVKKDEITEVLSKMFSSAQKIENFFAHPLDSSGNSNVDSIEFQLNSGDEARLDCNDWEENFRIKNNFFEGLSVGIYSEEIVNWYAN